MSNSNKLDEDKISIDTSEYSNSHNKDIYTTVDFPPLLPPDVTFNTTGAALNIAQSIWQDNYITLDPTSWNSVYTTTSSNSLTKDGLTLDVESDIKIGGESLKDFMSEVRSRLALLKPNCELEKDWDELRALGDAYRKLESEICAKMKTLEILKKDYENGSSG